MFSFLAFAFAFACLTLSMATTAAEPFTSRALVELEKVSDPVVLGTQASPIPSPNLKP